MEGITVTYVNCFKCHMLQKESEVGSFPMMMMLKYVYKRVVLKCAHILIHIAHSNALPIHG